MAALVQSLILNSRKRGGVGAVVELVNLWEHFGRVPPEGDIQPPEPGEGVPRVPRKIKKTIKRTNSYPICVDNPHERCYTVITINRKEEKSWLKTT